MPKRQVFFVSVTVTTFHISRAGTGLMCGARILLLGGGEEICDIDMFWAPPLSPATTTFEKHRHIKSLIYFIVQTLLLIHKLKAVSCYK
jgi:hypothetical protein